MWQKDVKDPEAVKTKGKGVSIFKELIPHWSIFKIYIHKNSLWKLFKKKDLIQ